MEREQNDSYIDGLCKYVAYSFKMGNYRFIDDLKEKLVRLHFQECILMTRETDFFVMIP